MHLQFTRKQWVGIYGMLCGLLILSLIQFLDINAGLTVSFLDVGQGDSILIKTPEHHTILIDAGPGSATADELGKQLGFFDKTLDLFVLTHPDRDHFGGILDVMQKYQIKRVLMSGVISSDVYYQSFLDQLKKEGIPIEYAQSNQDYQISPDTYLDVLYPLTGQHLAGLEAVDKNNTSVVLRLLKREGDGFKPLMVLTGDAEKPEEFEILVNGEEVSGDILKLGHHGSKSATSDVFLASVHPNTAIVSAGFGNKFGHPNPEILEKLKNIRVRRTDKEGRVVLRF